MGDEIPASGRRFDDIEPSSWGSLSGIAASLRDHLYFTRSGADTLERAIPSTHMWARFILFGKVVSDSGGSGIAISDERHPDEGPIIGFVDEKYLLALEFGGISEGHEGEVDATECGGAMAFGLSITSQAHVYLTPSNTPEEEAEKQEEVVHALAREAESRDTGLSPVPDPDTVPTQRVSEIEYTTTTGPDGKMVVQVAVAGGPTYLVQTLSVFSDLPGIPPEVNPI